MAERRSKRERQEKRYHEETGKKACPRESDTESGLTKENEEFVRAFCSDEVFSSCSPYFMELRNQLPTHYNVKALIDFVDSLYKEKVGERSLAKKYPAQFEELKKEYEKNPKARRFEKTQLAQRLGIPREKLLRWWCGQCQSRKKEIKKLETKRKLKEANERLKARKLAVECQQQSSSEEEDADSEAEDTDEESEPTSNPNGRPRKAKMASVENEKPGSRSASQLLPSYEIADTPSGISPENEAAIREYCSKNDVSSNNLVAMRDALNIKVSIDLIWPFVSEINQEKKEENRRQKLGLRKGDYEKLIEDFNKNPDAFDKVRKRKNIAMHMKIDPPKLLHEWCRIQYKRVRNMRQFVKPLKFWGYQLKSLQSYFKRNNKLDIYERKHIANKVKLTLQEVSNWFEAERKKLAGENEEAEDKKAEEVDQSEEDQEESGEEKDEDDEFEGSQPHDYDFDDYEPPLSRTNRSNDDPTSSSQQDFDAPTPPSPRKERKIGRREELLVEFDNGFEPSPMSRATQKRQNEEAFHEDAQRPPPIKKQFVEESGSEVAPNAYVTCSIVKKVRPRKRNNSAPPGEVEDEEKSWKPQRFEIQLPPTVTSYLARKPTLATETQIGKKVVTPDHVAITEEVGERSEVPEAVKNDTCDPQEATGADEQSEQNGVYSIEDSATHKVFTNAPVVTEPFEVPINDESSSTSPVQPASGNTMQKTSEPITSVPEQIEHETLNQQVECHNIEMFVSHRNTSGDEAGPSYYEPTSHHEASNSAEVTNAAKLPSLATIKQPPRMKSILKSDKDEKQEEEERRRLDELEEVPIEHLELLDPKPETNLLKPHIYTAEEVEEMKPEVKEEPVDRRFQRGVYPVNKKRHDIIPPPQPEIEEEEGDEEGVEGQQQDLEWDQLHYDQWNADHIKTFLLLDKNVDPKRLENFVTAAAGLNMEINGEMLEKLIGKEQLSNGEFLYKKLKLTLVIVDSIHKRLLAHEDNLGRV